MIFSKVRQSISFISFCILFITYLVAGLVEFQSDYLFTSDHYFETTANVPRHIAVIGNPGTGKSTLLNSILQQSFFQSGLSFGGGLTQYTLSYSSANLTLYDTPGLNDIHLRRQAAGQIQSLLDLQDVPICFIFVITLQSCRIRAEDVATLHIVLDAIDINFDLKDKYMILINMVTPTEMEMLESKKGDVIRYQITGKERRTMHWIYISRDAEIESADNVLINLEYETLNRILNAPITKPVDLYTKYIDVRPFEERLEEEREKLKLREKELEDSINQRIDEIWKNLEVLGIDDFVRSVIYQYNRFLEFDFTTIRNHFMLSLVIICLIVRLIQVFHSFAKICIFAASSSTYYVNEIRLWLPQFFSLFDGSTSTHPHEDTQQFAAEDSQSENEKDDNSEVQSTDECDALNEIKDGLNQSNFYNQQRALEEQQNYNIDEIQPISSMEKNIYNDIEDIEKTIEKEDVIMTEVEQNQVEEANIHEIDYRQTRTEDDKLNINGFIDGYVKEGNTNNINQLSLSKDNFAKPNNLSQNSQSYTEKTSTEKCKLSEEDSAIMMNYTDVNTEFSKPSESSQINKQLNDS